MFDFIPPDIFNAILLAIKYIYLSSPIWLPVVFIMLVFNAWVAYRRAGYWAGMGSVVLEIKLPKEVFKNPSAMEIILGALHQTADESGWYFKYWKGQTRSWFSLEIVSNGGEIHFYIWCRKKYQNSIENHIYSQYPGAEVYAVEDYTKPFYYDPNKYSMWACEWKLTQPDPYPIKTYVDYGLDKDPKEEFKVDPMSSMLEFLTSAVSGQQIWFQIIIRAHKKEQTRALPWAKKWEKLAWSETYDGWQEEAEKEIKKIIEKFRPEDKEKQSRQPTEGEKEAINALGRSTSKYPFDVGIRTMFLSEKEKNSSAFVGGIIGSFKQFGSPGSNGFQPSGWLAYFDRPWKKWTGKDEKLKPLVIEEYKLRNYFFSPYKDKYFYSKPFVLNTEEIATLYHFPGSTAAAPGVMRVPSKKSDAPSNLPI